MNEPGVDSRKSVPADDKIRIEAYFVCFQVAETGTDAHLTSGFDVDRRFVDRIFVVFICVIIICCQMSTDVKAGIPHKFNCSLKRYVLLGKKSRSAGRELDRSRSCYRLLKHGSAQPVSLFFDTRQRERSCVCHINSIARGADSAGRRKIPV